MISQGNWKDPRKQGEKGVCIVITDVGQVFDPRAAPDPLSKESLRAEHEHGIHLEPWVTPKSEARFLYVVATHSGYSLALTKGGHPSFQRPTGVQNSVVFGRFWGSDSCKGNRIIET